MSTDTVETDTNSPNVIGTWDVETAEQRSTWKVTHYGPDDTFHGRFHDYTEAEIDQIRRQPGHATLTSNRDPQTDTSWPVEIEHRDTDGTLLTRYTRNGA